MAETNSLVKRVVEILSKKHENNAHFYFNQIGVIKFIEFDDEGEDYTWNSFFYDPSKIDSFLDAYEKALMSYAVDKFIWIGTREMFVMGKYK